MVARQNKTRQKSMTYGANDIIVGRGSIHYQNVQSDDFQVCAVCNHRGVQNCRIRKARWVHARERHR